MFDFLLEKPFFLTVKEAEKVSSCIRAIPSEEKVGHLLCPCLSAMDEKQVRHLIDDIHVGGIMLRPFPSEGLKESLKRIVSESKTPLLVSANLENGGSGVLTDGTLFANPMGVSATDDSINAYRLGKISCQQAGSVGVNWAYAPIVDLDLNYHNPITNTRTFGNSPAKVKEFAGEYIRAAREEGIIPTVKHFPGDGVDERDQHLLVSVNSLSYEKWMESYGYVYSSLINDGVESVMAAHIAAPEVARHVNKDISDREAYLPASLSKELINGFLRKELGFAGLVVTDSTLMVGYLEKMPRKDALAASVNAGVDMILFSRNVDEDYSYLLSSFREGKLSEERIDEALARIIGLAVKANRPAEKREPISEETIGKWTKEAADRAVTLVKDPDSLLPLNPNAGKRIFLNVIENKADSNSPFVKAIKARFEREGFDVFLRRRDCPEITPQMLFSGDLTPEMLEALGELNSTTDDFVGRFDLAVIVLNMETASNSTVVRVNWKVLFGMGNDIPWYAGEMPLLVASFANPYHLLDIPMADAYVNCYTKNEETIDAFFDKIMGRSPFKGVSPIDPFCGHGDTRI